MGCRRGPNCAPLLRAFEQLWSDPRSLPLSHEFPRHLPEDLCAGQSSAWGCDRASRLASRAAACAAGGADGS